MSVYLEAVAQAAEKRQESEADYRAALTRATDHHSLAQIAAAAGVSKGAVAWLVKNGRSNDVGA